jgi:hypothetical protein
MRMRLLPLVLVLPVLIALFAVLASAPARADGFLSAYEDLPLAPGLAEVAGSGLSFDSASGRIIEAYASGKVAATAVLTFYAATLPQLGWTRDSDTLYHRDSEVLHIEPAAESGAVVVHFTISPE